MPKNKNITTEDFDRELFRILSGLTGDKLIALVPDIYEAVAEYFNNEIIDTLM